jgi:hypothetical protein
VKGKAGEGKRHLCKKNNSKKTRKNPRKNPKKSQRQYWSQPKKGKQPRSRTNRPDILPTMGGEKLQQQEST